jgi:hypothetical protein
MTASQLEQFRVERQRLMNESHTAQERALNLRISSHKSDHKLERTYRDKVHQAHEQYRRLLPEIPVA